MNRLCATVLCLSLSFCAPLYALTSSTVDGPAYLNSGKIKANIYHAFDLAYVTANPLIPPTFEGADTTPINDRLKYIASKGYTHIQISPPTQTTPSVQYHDAWWVSYKPLICDLGYAADASTPPYYQKELEAAGSVLGKSLKDYSAYGVKIKMSDETERVVGYRLGSDRYGSAADLATLIKNAKAYNLGIIVDVVFHQIGWQNEEFSENPVGYTFHAVNCSGPNSGSINTTGIGLIAKSSLSNVHLNSKVSSKPATVASVAKTAAETAATETTAVDTTPTKETGAETIPVEVIPTPATNFIVPFDPSNQDVWQHGPVLNVNDPMVQTMAAGYLQLLHDIGVVGLRLDHVMATANEGGLSGLWAILAKSPDFPFGYAEVWSGNLKHLPAFGELFAKVGDALI